MKRRKALKTLGIILAGAIGAGTAVIPAILSGCEQSGYEQKKSQNLETRVVVEACRPIQFPCFGPDNKVYYNTCGGQGIVYDNSRVFSAPIEGKTIHRKNYRENEGRIVVDIKDRNPIDIMHVAPCGIFIDCGEFYFFDHQGNLLRKVDSKELKENEQYKGYKNLLRGIYDGNKKGYYAMSWPENYFIPFNGSEIVLLESVPGKIKQRETAREILNDISGIGINFANQVRVTEKGDVQVLYTESAKGWRDLKLMTLKKDYFAGRERDYEAILRAYKNSEGGE